MTIAIARTRASLGAIVTNVSLAQLDDATWAEIHDAFLEFGVLVFPGQHIDEAAQDAFARRFGAIEKLSPTQQGASISISNTKPDGSLAQPGEYQYQILRGNEGWHTDSSYMPLASKAAMLTALVLPPEGGATEFADMRAAYEALDEATRDRLETMSAYHSLYYSQAKAGFVHKTDDSLYGLHDKGAPLRPLVKVHPKTGRKSIYTGRHAYRIEGLSEGESAPLLSELLEQACRPSRIYIHEWNVGDTVVWDNRCLLHRARPYDPGHVRALRGTRIAGDPATELAPTFADERADSFNPSGDSQIAAQT